VTKTLIPDACEHHILRVHCNSEIRIWTGCTQGSEIIVISASSSLAT